jgi:CRISPR-associated protein Cmr4
MSENIYFFIAESPVHAGCGQAMDAVDLPVIRERATGYPYLPGSTVKGVIREECDKNNQNEKINKNQVFGSQDKAGQVLVGDLNLLFFPVRCYELGWVWLTCPDLLRRYNECVKRQGGKDVFSFPVTVEEDNFFTCSDSGLSGKIHLEEFLFNKEETAGSFSVPANAIEHFPAEDAQNQCSYLEKKLLLISDKCFAYFVKNATEVVTRVRIDGDKGVVDKGALFYEECLPRDTVFYNTIAVKNVENFKIPDYLRMGGDRTIGRGIFHTLKIEGGQE